MSGLRLAFVTRRFWPLVGENELLLASLTHQLLRRGHHPTILTPRYGKYWPDKVCVRGVPVVRPPYPSPRTWGNIRFTFATSGWLQARAGELDAVIVSGPQEDALTALGALRSSNVAVVLQDELGLATEPTPRRFGEQFLRRVVACDAFIDFAPGSSSAANSTASEAPARPPEKTHAIALGVEPQPVRSPELRLAARQALAEVNHDLSAGGPVGLCLAPMVERSQLELLARAWRPIQGRYPDARLWIIGDGPSRGSLFSLLSDLNLKYRIVLPGTFDDWSELMQAADFLVQPNAGPSLGLAPLQAMAAGLPVVLYQSPHPTTPLPEAGDASQPTCLYVQQGESEAQLTSRLAWLVDHADEAVKLGSRARKQVEEQYPLAAMVDNYERLLRSVVAGKTNRAGPA
jgi:glycosyltransferase involved in cell wall biosynthesis